MIRTERVALFRMRLLTIILGVFTLTACVDNRFMRVGEDASSSGIPAYQQVDDSLHLVAREWTHQMFGAEEPAIPSSDDAPGRYTWSSSNSRVADVTANGWMRTHSIGQAIITVRGPSSSYSQAVSVCSRDTYLRIDPEDPVINLHDTITVRVSLRQPAGGECGNLDYGLFMPQQGTGKAGLEPIFSQPNRWRAIATGTYWYTSNLVFARHILRDSVLVTIR